MTESEALSALIDIADISSGFQSIWISITFAYLTVAYFLGKALSRFQCFAVTVLYIYGAFYYSGVALTWQRTFELIQSREGTIIDKAVGIGIPWPEVGLFFYTAGTLISLYFMYNVRKQVEQ